VGARGGHHVLQHDVAGGAVSRNVGDEALEQHAIQTILLHPAEMAGYGLTVSGREETGRLGAEGHVGQGAEFIGIELTQVGIHVDGEGGGGGRAVRPMAPVGTRGSAAGAAEPALVAEQHLAGEGGRVHRLRACRGREQQQR
jgi:hypothetical protein